MRIIILMLLAIVGTILGRVLYDVTHRENP